MYKFALIFAAFVTVTAHADLDRQIQIMVAKSLPQLACNLSVTSPGSVIASPERQSPNYYFHWVRDSALIVDALTRLLPFTEGTENAKRIHKFIADFSSFSKRLQNTPTPYGSGEVRFNPDGTLDTDPWPRPQHDGPALRALALIRYLRGYEGELAPQTASLMREIVLRDLESVVRTYNSPGFDLWEYSTGFHFYTRMVQAASMREGQLLFGKNPEWKKAELVLYAQLERHWNRDEQVIAFNDGPAQDADGRTIPAFPVRYDTSVSLGVIHAALPAPHFSVLDSRVWMTLAKLEQYFLDAFPLNAGKKMGAAMGRHKGDGYYGGNAFFFLTAAYSELSFRIAGEIMRSEGELIAGERSIATLRRVLQHTVKRNSRIQLPDTGLAQAFAREGDEFLRTMLDAIPADGTIAEQFSKVDGKPASAQKLSWSYASILTAILEREKWRPTKLDFSQLDFRCR